MQPIEGDLTTVHFSTVTKEEDITSDLSNMQHRYQRRRASSDLREISRALPGTMLRCCGKVILQTSK